MPDSQHAGRSYGLLFVGLLSLVMLASLIYAQYYFSKRADDALCSTLIRLVERSSVSLEEHPYYQRNPQDLQYALDQNNQTLQELRNACPE